ncbi:MAG: TonB-dependent receptor plug domain-containing protein [Spirochaetes bacterium]|nr:TonB-dependent receptor plug domain-containing protein [Spirochaetota bacterium]
MKFLRLALVLLSGLIFTQVLSAQDATVTETQIPENESVPEETAEIKDKKEIKSDENSGTLVITKEDIKKINANNIQDILNQIPGVSAGDSSVLLRGSSSVKVLLNGRPLNDPTSGHGGIKWGQVSLNNIEKIEIIKGGGSVVYGDNSSGGVIVITTTRGAELSGMVDLWVGNYETGKASADINTSMGDLNVQATGSYEQTEGYFRNHDTKKYRAGMRMSHLFSPKYSISPSFDYYGQEGGVIGTKSSPSYYSRKDYEFFSGGLIAKLDKVKSNFYINKGINNDTDSSKDKDTIIEVMKTGEELNSGLEINDYLNLSFGAGAEYISGKGTGTGLDYYGTRVDYGFDEEDEKNAFGFISNKTQLKALDLAISAGARAVYYSDYQNVINPEASVSFCKNWFGAKVNFAMSNNTPSFLQRFQATSYKDPNPELDMEKSINYAATVYLFPFKWINLTVSGFYNEIKDRITYVRNYNGTGNNRYENFGKVTYKGAEGSLKLAPVKFIQLNTAYSYMIAKDEETGLWMPCKAKHEVNSKLKISPVKNASVSLEIEYQSDVYTDSANTETAEAHTLFNGYTDYRIGAFILNFEIKNIADKEYLMSDGIEGYPRRWLLGVKYEF